MALPIDEWIEVTKLKQLEENIATTINEVDDIDSAVRCIMTFVRMEFELRGIAK